MEPANKFGLEYLTYVLWAITPEGRANNLGEIILNEGKSELHVTAIRMNSKCNAPTPTRDNKEDVQEKFPPFTMSTVSLAQCGY